MTIQDSLFAAPKSFGLMRVGLDGGKRFCRWSGSSRSLSLRSFIPWRFLLTCGSAKKLLRVHFPSGTSLDDRPWGSLEYRLEELEAEALDDFLVRAREERSDHRDFFLVDADFFVRALRRNLRGMPYSAQRGKIPSAGLCAPAARL